MRRGLVVFGIAFVCLSVSSSMADMVTYDMGNAALGFTQATGNFLVQESALSQLYLELDDPGGVALDNVAILGGGNFDLTLDLSMFDLPGANNWTAVGTLKFTDLNTATNAVEAGVISTSIAANGSWLQIDGYLQDLNPPTTILVNRGDPWVFVGNADAGGANADGTANQITVPGSQFYDGGTLVTLKFGMTLDLDTFFSEDRSLTGGEVKGAIVPAPAAVLLGVLGLGAAGLKLRKYA